MAASASQTAGAARSPGRAGDLRYTERDFQALRALLREHAGIALGESKRCMVYARLARRLRALGIDRFSHYVERLRGGDEPELRAFVSALSTNVTAFFREPHHFEFLAARALPELAAARRRTRRLRIWSAGCSSGEEAYSIASSALEVLPDPATWDLKILATDIDGGMVERARRGVYAADALDLERCAGAARWFRRGAGANRRHICVGPQLRSLVHFRRHNLLADWPMRGPFDLIFCRNVLIYFDRPTQAKLHARFADMLADDGFFFVGHSESLVHQSGLFSSVGRTVYQKARA